MQIFVSSLRQVCEKYAKSRSLHSYYGSFEALGELISIQPRPFLEGDLVRQVKNEDRF
jgi:hypothetical protein